MFTRRNVWLFDDAWATDIVWYARAVQAMRAKPITDKTSWRFLAAIHGFDAALWRHQGYLAGGEALPSQAVQDRFWNQCQHGGWFFNPWHRGYLLAFEKIVREQVIALHGPATWALPYWNYFGTAGKTSQALMPPAFASGQWPDGGANPLHVPQRYGPGATELPLDKLDQAVALAEPRFVAAAPKGDPGFGGGDVGGFESHGGRPGRLEMQPHNNVHGLIGGHGGLMTRPASAALDPIFWLHHANIDRLWQTWNQGPPARPDPPDSFWRHGPSGPGQRPFVMPVSGGPDWVYTPVMVESIRDLGYDYESVDPVGDTPADRQVPEGQPDEERDVSDGTDVELVGANEAPVVLRAEAPELTRVLLDPAVLEKVVRSRGGGVGEADQRPDRVFLNLENVRGTSDAAGFGVFLGAPDDRGVAPALVDWVVPFGVEEATDPDGRHAGQGLAYTLEITDLVAGLLGRGVGIEQLEVRLEPMEIFASGSELTIGQISAYRQGT